METVHLPRTLVNRLLHLAQETPEREVCGLIAATNGIPDRCHPVCNVADDPARRFLLDAGEQIDLLRRLRENGQELFAVFHSHPAAPALPSREDVDKAAYPEALYLIVSLGTQGVLELRGFRHDEAAGRYAEVDLRLGDA
jgi:proteasome lid subunit RPN8/RPN11